MRWFWQIVAPEETREDWLVVEAVRSYGDLIRSRINASHLDRVLRARMATLAPS